MNELGGCPNQEHFPQISNASNGSICNYILKSKCKMLHTLSIMVGQYSEAAQKHN